MREDHNNVFSNLMSLKKNQSIIDYLKFKFIGEAIMMKNMPRMNHGQMSVQVLNYMILYQIIKRRRCGPYTPNKAEGFLKLKSLEISVSWKTFRKTRNIMPFSKRIEKYND